MFNQQVKQFVASRIDCSGLIGYAVIISAMFNCSLTRLTVTARLIGCIPDISVASRYIGVSLLLLLSLMFYSIELCAQQVVSVAVDSSAATHDTQVYSDERMLMDGWRDEIDSMQRAANLVRAKFERQKELLRYSIDSLNTMNIPVEKLHSKLDSLETISKQQISEISDSVSKWYQSTMEKVEALHLPPDVQQRVQQGLSQIVSNSGVPSLNSTDIIRLPLIGEHLTDVSDLLPGETIVLPELNLPVRVDLPGSIATIPEIPSHLSIVPPASLNTDVAALAEQQVMNTTLGQSVGSEITAASDALPAVTDLNENGLKELALSRAKEEFVDHFAGKEAEVKDAMSLISKYKAKFSSLKSLDEIPKKKPNTMRELVFSSRLVPGMVMQIQRKGDVLCVDFNPYTGFRLTDEITFGAGWNQRLGYDTRTRSFANSESIVFGPRLFSEYKLSRGFSPRVIVEAMNTYVPSNLTKLLQDSHSRQWIFGVFVGLKKDYTLVKNVRGVAEVTFRLYDAQDRSPYGDVVNARFGFEIPSKPKQKKQEL